MSRLSEVSRVALVTPSEDLPYEISDSPDVCILGQI